jgi:putative membrane protein
MVSDTYLRDSLAIQRTQLANERTLLAAIRTGLGLAAAGAGVIKVMNEPIAWMIGLVLITSGAVTLSVGVRRFYRVREQLRALIV